MFFWEAPNVITPFADCNLFTVGFFVFIKSDIATYKATTLFSLNLSKNLASQVI
jgi:hypothetical protein